MELLTGLLPHKKGDVEVMNEEFAINFPSDYLLHLQQPGGFHTAYDNLTHMFKVMRGSLKNG